MRIKVCGLTQIDQMHALGDLGVQFAGMIFYEPSPRYVLRHLRAEEVKSEKLKVFKVGVFVNATYEEMVRQIDAFGLDMVQLHGNETPWACDKISSYIQTIKAFRITAYDNIEYKIKDFYRDTDLFLFDNGIGTGGAKNYGGTGEKFNWNRLKTVPLEKPWLLSGGIGPEDTEALKTFSAHPAAKNLFALDINSRFETSPGIKDLELVKHFVQELNGKL